ncbi:MAG: orotidine-5'-phosphate decarboxylase [Treponema sp.]|jgi:orotidine-5'-phosphate decarboxylase|nr:orotidine-5'-phosphate decarboxylase [Treponema sp.]
MVFAMDRLYESVEKNGCVCVGLDTAPSYIPPIELRRSASSAEATLAFNRALIDATVDIAACFKVQIAYYEALGLAGLRVYAKTLRYISKKGGLVIADVKRGDVADTAAQYAKAHFSGDFSADFVTLSPYMGMDSLDPWLSFAEKAGKGAFVLMRTSNPGRCDFQERELVGRIGLWKAVGEKLSALAEKHHGVHGYGVFGAVVGCTVDEAVYTRQYFADLFFLIPGFGAQGGTSKDVVPLLKNGNGGVVNASRSILTAWTKSADAASADNASAALAARSMVLRMRDEIRRHDLD